MGETKENEKTQTEHLLIKLDNKISTAAYFMNEFGFIPEAKLEDVEMIIFFLIFYVLISVSLIEIERDGGF